jgi:cytoskeletal protein CcmA (bactofilin family)
MGDIATQRIYIDEGAYFKGIVDIRKEASKKRVLGAARSIAEMKLWEVSLVRFGMNP